VLALAGNLLFPEDVEAKILPALAHAFLHPVVAVIFVLALMSAVLSTIDSAILSPASVLAQNVFPRLGKADTLKSNRLAVLMVATFSLGLAYVGESAYALLEEAYLLTMVGLFVPLMIGLYSLPHGGRAAIASMLVGTGLWGLHFAMDWEVFLQPIHPFQRLQLPLSLMATLCATIAYFWFEPPWKIRWSRGIVAQDS
jgi:SSS family solute:Na+ symporter